MRRLFAAAAAAVLLLTPATAMAAPAPTSTPSGNVQFKVTLPPSKPTSPTPTSPGHSAGNRGVSAGTGTPTGQLLILAGGLLLIGCLVLLGSRLLPARPGSNSQARPHR